MIEYAKSIVFHGTMATFVLLFFLPSILLFVFGVLFDLFPKEHFLPFFFGFFLENLALVIMTLKIDKLYMKT